MRFKIAVLLAATLLALLAAEFAVRLLLPRHTRRALALTARNVFQYDRANVAFHPQLGFLSRPNLQARFTNTDFDTRVSTNSLGFRDDVASFESPDLLLLGDSYAFGWGVNDEEICDRHLESLLGAQVANLSSPGYGTLQEYLLLRWWFLDKRPAPRGIIILFYGNDATDSVGYGFGSYPSLTLQPNGKFGLKPPTPEGFEAWISACERATVPRPLRFSTLLSASWAAFAPPAAPQRDDPGAPSEPEALALVFRNISELCMQHGIPVAVAYVPRIQSFDGESDEVAVQRITALLDRHEIPLIDLRPALALADYHATDEHWRASGHRRAAAQIAAFIQSEGWLEQLPATRPASDASHSLQR